jgi:hypothetical protein
MARQLDIEKTYEEPDKPIDKFMKELKIDGRYFVGNEIRVTYISKHKKEIETYLLNLRNKDPTEANLLADLLKLNSKPRSSRIFNLSDRLDKPNIRIPISKKKGYIPSERTISIYSSIPRKNIEKGIFILTLVGLIATSTYLGKKYCNALSHLIEPYVQKMDKFSYEIYHGR